ncbi:hypothetical protein WJX72_000959 [[Myrmecia] bisecta]|uniref:BZIP domain-containing protein n=1 Tax=[Myrmecia] bisecta TaxID=41462 RepID=A0AAW1Q052_9CHLO
MSGPDTFRPQLDGLELPEGLPESEMFGVGELEFNLDTVLDQFVQQNSFPDVTSNSVGLDGGQIFVSQQQLLSAFASHSRGDLALGASLHHASADAAAQDQAIASSSGSGDVSTHSKGSGDLPTNRKGATAEKLMSRAERTANKNRQAQARFRARTKAKAKETEEQLKHLTEQLQRLQTENVNLASRNSVLEKCLDLREEQIQIMHEQQQILEPGADLAAPMDDIFDTACPGSFGTGCVALNTASKPYADKHMVMLLDSQPSGVASFAHPMALIARTGSSHTEQDVRAMSCEDFIRAWKGYVRVFATLLMADVDTPQVEQQLLEAKREAGQLCMRTAVLNPLNIMKLLSCNMEDKPGADGSRYASAERWRAVTRSLAMTPEQRGEIAKLRQEYQTSCRRIMEERQQIYARVQTVSVGDMTESRLVARASLAMHKALQELKQNLRSGHSTGLLFIATVLSRVFTPLQFARAAVQSYPLYPDMLAITQCVGEEGTDASPVAASPPTVFSGVQQTPIVT